MKRRMRMKRRTTLQRFKELRVSTAQLTDAERAAYALVTELARTPEGYLECDGCGRSLLDGEEQRHHVRYRSHGGKTEPENLAILCRTCHALAHGIHTVETRRDDDQGVDEWVDGDGALWISDL